MNIWWYVGIGVGGILLIVLGVFLLNSYIDTKAETIANKAILDSKIQYQQKEQELRAELDAEYKNNIKVVTKTIEKKVPVIVTDGACESELAAIKGLINYKWGYEE